MKLRDFVFVITLILILTSCVSKKEKKNVLLIFVDDFRPEINSWGHHYIQTPNLDRLAEAGVSFRNTYCQYANSSPSRRSIMTGLDPETTGHETDLTVYSRYIEHETMPQHFKKAGYLTSSFGKVYHGADEDKAVWDYFFDVQYPEDLKEIKRMVPWECYASRANMLLEGTERPATECEDLPLTNYNDYNVCQAARKKLAEYKNTTFFMAVGFRKPHLPFAAPKKFWDLYDRNEIALPEFPEAPVGVDSTIYMWSEIASYTGYYEHYYSPEKDYRTKHLTKNEMRELRHGYYACVSFIDSLIEELMDELKAQELDNNTIVVLISDHGYQLGDQQIIGKHNCFNYATNVPLIIYDPTQLRGKEINTQYVESLNLYPTLSEMCGLPEPPKCDGKSFASLYGAKEDLPGFDASFNQYRSFQKGKIRNKMGYAIHTKDYTFIEWRDYTDSARKTLSRELYRVTDDCRTETVNIASEEYQDLMDSLSTRITEKYTPYTRTYYRYLDIRKQKDNK